MVYIVLISLLTLLLLALLVLGLHRYQLSIVQTNADKHSALPPLDNISMERELPDLSLSDETDLAIREKTRFDVPPRVEPGEDTEIVVPEGAPQSDEVTEVAFVNSAATQYQRDQDQDMQAPSTSIPLVAGAVPAMTEPELSVSKSTDKAMETVPAPAQEPERKDKSSDNQAVNDSSSPSDLAITDPSKSSASWQERVAELKNLNRLEEALQVCRQEFPLWSAYQQASLIHRAKIKQLIQNELDVSAELAALYQLAAEASFLHDRVKGLPNLSLAQLKLLDLSPIADLEMPYSQIGYTGLRLIKKTDIKLLLETWGNPESHRSPREIHADCWQALCSDTQSTLF